LEDRTGMVKLDLSQCQVLSDGYICESCIVLVEGEYLDDILHVYKIGHPPTESRLDTIQSIGYAKLDIFGTMPSESEFAKTRNEELIHGIDGMFVILSDVHLDNPEVMEKLKTLFQGFYDNHILPLFVFIGNFTSKPITSQEGIRYLTTLMEDLAHLISKQFPRLAKEAKFIFVPGPQDLGSTGNILPRGPLPKLACQTIKSKLSHLTLASNPCRIRYFTKEFVICRHSFVQALGKHSIVPPRINQVQDENMNDSNPNTQELALTQDAKKSTTNCDTIDHAIKTMLDQAHLTPLPLMSQPIFWQYDHALRLYPLPDALIVADNSSVPAYCRTYRDCSVVHPGSFGSAKNPFGFVVLYPAGRNHEHELAVELSQIE